MGSFFLYIKITRWREEIKLGRFSNAAETIRQKSGGDRHLLAIDETI